MFIFGDSLHIVIETLKSLTSNERRVFLIHLGYSLLDGLVLGVLALNEFVLIKSLKGSDYQIGILFQLTVILMLFSVLFNEWIRRIRNKQKLMRLLGLVTRLPLLALVFFPDSLEGVLNQPIYGYVFLIIFLLFYLSNPVVFPLISQMLKTHYRHEFFGRLYSYAASLNKIVMLFATFAFGWLLDLDPFSFRYVYPVIAILGISSLYLLSAIPYHESAALIPRDGLLNSITDSLKRLVGILSRNKPYLDLQVSFMFYGFAWMSTIAVITIFLENQLKLNYSSVAFYKNAYNLVAILILPFFGRIIGQTDPRRFAMLTFASLMFFLLFLTLSEYFPSSFSLGHIQVYHMLIPAYIAHALFAATMSLLWYIGPAYFGKPSEAGDYQSIHQTLTGFRGLFAPLLGVVLYQWLGYTLSFSLGILSLLIAIVLMNISLKRRPLHTE